MVLVANERNQLKIDTLHSRIAVEPDSIRLHEIGKLRGGTVVGKRVMHRRLRADDTDGRYT